MEVLQSSLLGGGPADEDPVPAEGVDPHPLPGNIAPAPEDNAANMEEDNDNDDNNGWGHWALPPVAQAPQNMEPNEALNDLMEAIEAEEVNVEGNPPEDSSLTLITQALQEMLRSLAQKIKLSTKKLLTRKWISLF